MLIATDQPPYFFRIVEIEQTEEAPEKVDSRGNWEPNTVPGANRAIGGGVSGNYYYCDKQRILQVSQLPPGTQHYKTFSVYFAGGQGFWVLRGNAINPPESENWHPLRFDHHPTDYSSFLTNAGDQPTLRAQRTDQEWPKMLLPDIYHTPTRTPYQQYGGLTGELPLLLALVAFSTSREWLPNVLPTVFVDGAWKVHEYQLPSKIRYKIYCAALTSEGTNRRGVIVSVYTCPQNYAGGSTADELEQYEHGNLGKYFN